jgi:hypothetical protein
VNVVGLGGEIVSWMRWAVAVGVLGLRCSIQYMASVVRSLDGGWECGNQVRSSLLRSLIQSFEVHSSERSRIGSVICCERGLSGGKRWCLLITSPSVHVQISAVK